MCCLEVYFQEKFGMYIGRSDETPLWLSLCQGLPLRSRTPRRRHRSRSRSYDEEKGVWKSSSRRRRSRSRSHDRRHSRERDYYGHRRSRSRDRDRRDRNFYYNDRYRRSRSRERMRRASDDLRLKIDKAKLREIAMKNAYAMLNSDEVVKTMKPDQIAALKAGGKSVEELTNFCRKIAEKDPRHSSSDEEIPRYHSDEEEDSAQPFINHPFKVNPVANIALNIRNAKQIPVTSFADRAAKASELRIQFPVSSGSQHKNKEDQWTPVEKTSAPAAATTTTAATSTVAQQPTSKPSATATSAVTQPKALPKPGALVAPAATAAAAMPVAAAATAVTETKKEDKVFPEAKEIDINIGAVVSERLSAMRKLQSNPNDVEAMGAMYKAQQAMNEWAQEKQVPGQFTGHTGLKSMSQKELHGSGYQAWLKKDMFHKAAPVRGGIGKLLLQKMGWREGTGLGKDETGDVNPLNLDIKVDRKGLMVADEQPSAPPAKAQRAAPAHRDLSGKHPVSALMELCKKRRWNQPHFDLAFECGPAHKKNFVFKCNVNGVDYQPTIASPNKKHAKAQAATVVLQHFGLVPKDGPI